MSEVGIFVSSTGNFNIITLHHMKNNAIVRNIGHFDNAMDLASSGGLGSFRLLYWSRCDDAGFRPTRAMSTSCLKSSMRNWRNCTILRGAHCPYSGTSRLYRCQDRRSFQSRVLSLAAGRSLASSTHRSAAVLSIEGSSSGSPRTLRGSSSSSAGRNRARTPGDFRTIRCTLA